MNCSTPQKVGIFVLPFHFNACCNLGSMTILPLTSRMQQNFWVGYEDNTSFSHVWGQESNGWQTRLAHSTEDRGALLAPLLLRMPEEKRCDLQVLINMGHCQEPYTNACIHAHPCIVL